MYGVAGRTSRLDEQPESRLAETSGRGVKKWGVSVRSKIYSDLVSFVRIIPVDPKLPQFILILSVKFCVPLPGSLNVFSI